MEACLGRFPMSHRFCERPRDHDGMHGNLQVEYESFRPPHLLAEYKAKNGSEVGDNALSPAAFDALAESAVSGNPPELVVIGAYQREDGVRYLDFGVPIGHVESVSEWWRWDENAKRFRLLCPECGLKDGKHIKSCGRG